MVGITIIGLGPGNPDLLTRQVWQILQNAPEIYLRTKQHPVVDSLPERLVVHSFDVLYDSLETFEQVYQQIIETILHLGRRPEGVIYAVPGHPLIAEATAPEIIKRAKEEDISVNVIDGLSFIEPVFTALGLDPFPQTVLVDALQLAVSHTPPFPTGVPALIAQIHSRAVASDVKLTLNSLYPDEHPVTLVHAAGTDRQIIEQARLFEIDRSEHIGLLSCLYVPPMEAETSFESFLEVVAHLRAPDGCPWDREQTHQSLRSDLIEETYEAVSAIDTDDPANMCEEFGDLILLILLQTQIASDNGEFNITDVLRGINIKIVRRHPHVFGDVHIKDEQALLKNWEKLKEAERQDKGNTEKSLLDGVALALPALVQSQVYQKRAARVGFDWPNIQGVLDKLTEELEEVLTASSSDERAFEIGDLLFAVVNLARWYDVDAESALREANVRFRTRFSHIERSAQKNGLSISDLNLEEMEAYWQEAKRLPPIS